MSELVIGVAVFLVIAIVLINILRNDIISISKKVHKLTRWQERTDTQIDGLEKDISVRTNEIKNLKMVIGGLVEDNQSLSERTEKLETILAKYEEAAKQVSKLSSISPRLARGSRS